MPSATKASCLYCREEFTLQFRKHRRHHCEPCNKVHNKEKGYRYYREAKLYKWGTWACCLFCREEFKINRTDQRMHGCPGAMGDYKKSQNRGVTEHRKGIRILDNLHLCPVCKVVKTANRYACSQCWGRIGDVYDVEMAVIVDAGTTRRLGYRTY